MRQVCRSADVEEGGRGVRFEIQRDGEPLGAFVVRYDGLVHAYVNECAHVAVQLDWNEGEFFDHSGLYLICATHGATYLPDSGLCAGGPCKGRALRKLEVVERDGCIFLME
ncbi:MAG: Rieske 2Fe-2S domain-containing protein [Betaproteobacteria bacterium]|nr:Rieske 2Fe-2S domain-containing protein [Betaproteobacteria bacterium]